VKYDGARYSFAAPLIAIVVRESDMTPGERRRFEGRAVEALADRSDLEGRALRCELLARARPNPEALAYVGATLQAAVEEGAQRVARRVQAALDRLNSPSAPPRRS
jgi:hypothetical protein